jgi:hypothetical protein
VVLDSTNFAARWVELVQMTAPASRVLALPVARRVAQSRTDSIRPRSRLAVSGFVCQIGSGAFIASTTSTACIGNEPKTGPA